MNRVNAQQARRVLDRLVGFQGSPVVRKQIRGAQSVGRVQTVALRLVVERENEIQNFQPETYFTVGAQVRKLEAPLDPFTVKLARINGEPVGIKDRRLLPGAVKTAEQLEDIRRELEHCPLKVSDIITKEVTRRARPPFITSTLQQSASGSLGSILPEDQSSLNASFAPAGIAGMSPFAGDCCASAGRGDIPQHTAAMIAERLRRRAAAGALCANLSRG